jgi:HD-like signal output (HDOD) protein
MGKLLEFVRGILRSVFGRGDLDFLLSDDFEIDPSMDPEGSPAALLRRAQARRGPPRPPRARRQSPPPAQLRDTVAQGMARDTYGSMSSLEIPEVEDFDWSLDCGTNDETAEAPAPRESVLRLVQPARPAAPRPSASLHDRPLVRGQVLASGALPPVITGSMSAVSAASAVGAASAVAAAALPAPESPQRGALFGPPPSTLWDEQEIKMELLEQLDEERAHPPDGVRRRDWRVVLDRLGRALSDLENQLPPLPSAAAKLLGVGGGSPSDEQVIEAIQGDPALAARLVKAANSPFYMSAHPASSLQSALVRMGLQEARKIAMAAAFEETFELTCDAELLAEMRRHALATAIAGEIFGRSAREVDSGEAFLAGLLHDAGALLVHRMVRDEGAGAQAVDATAARVLAMRTHQRVGALLLGEWDLDAGVAATLGWHHAPHLAEDRFAPLCQVVHVADLVADLALGHAESAAWKAARVHYAARDDETARKRAVKSDGIDELDLGELPYLVPPDFGTDRLRGVLRGVLLRLETSPV